MLWLSEPFEPTNCAAAFVKLPCSATATKALSSAKQDLRIV
jgi:hypothetical protein